MPNDQALTTSALKGAYEMEAAMAKLALSTTSQNFIPSPAGAVISTDCLANTTEKHLRKAIANAAAKLKAHEEARASWSRSDNNDHISDEESTSDEDDKSAEDETLSEKTGLGKARAPIKLKLFRKVQQTGDMGMNAITKGMEEHTLSADEHSTKAILEGSRGRLLQRQSPDLQRNSTDSPPKPSSVAGGKKQEDDRDERNESDKDRSTRRSRGKNIMKGQSGGRHPMRGTQSTGGRQLAQNASNQGPPLDPNGRDDTNNSNFDDSHVSNPDGSDDDTHDDTINHQPYLADALTHENDELLVHARARRRSFEVEAEDYDDWEGSVGSDEGDYYGGYEFDEGDEVDEDVDEEEEEEDEEDEEARLENKYGWSQAQSDRIRFTPPPRPSFNMPSQPSSSRPNGPAGTQVTESIETDVSKEQINDGLAEELRRTTLDETQPEAQH